MVQEDIPVQLVGLFTVGGRTAPDREAAECSNVGENQAQPDCVNSLTALDTVCVC